MRENLLNDKVAIDHLWSRSYKTSKSHCKFILELLNCSCLLEQKQEKWTDAEEDVKKCESMGEKPTSRPLGTMLSTHPSFSFSPALLRT